MGFQVPGSGGLASYHDMLLYLRVAAQPALAPVASTACVAKHQAMLRSLLRSTSVLLVRQRKALRRGA